MRDARDQGVVIALREIRPSDAASKQHIANKCALNLRRMKDNMSRGVPRAVPHLYGVRPQLNGVPVS